MPADQSKINTSELKRKPKSKKLPSWQFYPGDWFKDPGIQVLDIWHRGLWFEILLRMYECEERGVLLLNGKPMPVEALARALGEDNRKISDGITKLIEYGIASVRDSDGALISRRMIRDDDEKRAASEKNAENGSSGGNPAFQKGKPNPYYKRTDNRQDKRPDNPEDNPKITPSSSSSSSISSSSSDLKREEGSAHAPPPPIDEFESWAEEELCKPDGTQPWERTNQFMNCGRRPMKSYPNLFFTRDDLAEIFRQWSVSKIPKGRFRDGFQMLKATAQNKPNFELNAFKWAIGFIKTDLIKMLNEEVKLEMNLTRARA